MYVCIHMIAVVPVHHAAAFIDIADCVLGAMTLTASAADGDDSDADDSFEAVHDMLSELKLKNLSPLFHEHGIRVTPAFVVFGRWKFPRFRFRFERLCLKACAVLCGLALHGTRAGLHVGGLEELARGVRYQDVNSHSFCFLYALFSVGRTQCWSWSGST